MKFKIHNGPFNDYFIAEGDTIEECKVLSKKGVIVRSWTNPWSERLID